MDTHSGIASLHNGIFFFGSALGTSLLAKFVVGPNETPDDLKIVDMITNFGPVIVRFLD